MADTTKHPRRDAASAPTPPRERSRGGRDGPQVEHASDDTPLSSANSSDADPATRRAPLDSPRPQVTRHI